MKTFQLVLAIITILMVIGMFGFNLWVASNFSKGLTIPDCYIPMNIITTILVIITVITIFIRK